ncbi:MAG TPA: amidohydrolase [Bacteroidia bacterium]|nr:amidohydrolase [Bacteroidia bacterium]
MSIDYSTLRQFRRILHANPEVSGNEKNTARRVLAFLSECKPDELLGGIGGNGIIATWESGKPGKELVFRAELDALPIQEINSFEYASLSTGVSHKCGHDGHTTILCGLAQYLQHHKPATGKVRLLFQPSEENGEGAQAMLNDKKFQEVNPSCLFALHNLPGYPLHEIVVKEGTFTASVNSIIINLEGKTSHAAEPEHGLNPALAVADILRETAELVNNNPEEINMRVITPVFVELGEKAYGISAGNASIHLTLRCWDDDHLQQLENEVQDVAQKTAKAHKLKIAFEFTQTFHANVNQHEATQRVREAADSLNLNITEKAFPFKWGEDFGLFTTKFPGCMFGLGSGTDTPALHNPDYDFPDTLIETGVGIFSQIIKQELNITEPNV